MASEKPKEIIENGWILFDVYHKPTGNSKATIYDKHREMYYNPGRGWTKKSFSRKDDIRTVDLSKNNVHLRTSLVFSFEKDRIFLYFFDSTFDGRLEKWEMVGFCSLIHENSRLYSACKVAQNAFFIIDEQGFHEVNMDDIFQWIFNGIHMGAPVMISGELNHLLLDKRVKDEIVRLLYPSMFTDSKGLPQEKNNDELLLEIFDFNEIEEWKGSIVKSLIWLLSNNQNREWIDFMNFCEAYKLKNIISNFVLFRGLIPGRNDEKGIEIKDILKLNSIVLKTIRDEEFTKRFRVHGFIDIDRVFEIAGKDKFEQVVKQIASDYDKWDFTLMYTQNSLYKLKTEKDIDEYLSI